MKLTKDEAIKRLNELKGILVGTTDDILDDGFDSEDTEQNASYSAQVDRINSVGEELAYLEVEGVPDYRIDGLWSDAWQKGANTHLPEDRYNHHIRFIEACLEEFNKERNLK